MTTFTTHDIESAPEASKKILQGAQSQLGFVPNLYANMAESATVLESYTTLAGLFEKSSLSTTEQQVVLLTASVVNNCEFCVSAHSVISKNMLKIDENIVDAIRNQQTIPDQKLEALAEFTRGVVIDRGWVHGEKTESFLAAGFNQAQALEVVLGVTLKTLSNYSNHLTQTRTNKEFSAEAWSKAA